MSQQPEIVARMRFRRMPLAAAALWFALGIGAFRFMTQPPIVLIAALAVLAVISAFSLIRNGLRTATLPIAALWIVAGLASAEWQPGTPLSSPLNQYADNLSRTVRGQVTRTRTLTDETPQDTDSATFEETAEDPIDHPGRSILLDLQLEAVEQLTPEISQMVPIQGGLRATVYPDRAGYPIPTLHCGETVEMTIRLKLPERFRDPGAFQYADLLEAQGIQLHGNTTPDRIHPLSSGQTHSWANLRCHIYAAQTWAAERMTRYTISRPNRTLPPMLRLDQADAAMLNAMLFGDRTGLNHDLRVGFERTGSFHLFVVSGLHVALLAAAVFWITRKLRAPLWLATVITLVVATAYAILTGFGQPVQRALAMTAMYLAANLLQRGREGLNALGAAALGMLIWSPASLFDASFQMTALAILAIAGIAAPLIDRTIGPYLRGSRDIFGPDRRMPPSVAQLRLMLRLWGETFERLLSRRFRSIPAAIVQTILWAAELALIGTIAELVMVYPMAAYFHRAAVFALPANMVVIPILTLLAPAAVATFTASLISPWLAAIPGAATALLLHGVRSGIGRLSHLGVADVRIPGPAWEIGLAAVTGWLACAWLARRSRLGALTAALALPAIAALVLWPEPTLRTPNTLEVTALDVGQGDSLLVVGPRGSTMLVDAGGPIGRAGRVQVESGSGTPTTFDIGEDVVSPYLWSRRLRHLDVVALTHAHSDHMGGMPAVLRNLRPRELWVGIDPASTGYDALRAEATALGIRIRHLRTGDHIDWDDTSISVLGPTPDYRNPGLPKNDDSLVMRLDFGAGSALLEGDAERPSERTMLAGGVIYPVTLLKVGHHGSLSSTTPAFLAAAAPKAAIISAGRGNPFGHPRPEIIARIAAARVPLYRTDEFGLTTFLIDRKGKLQVK